MRQGKKRPHLDDEQRPRLEQNSDRRSVRRRDGREGSEIIRLGGWRVQVDNRRPEERNGAGRWSVGRAVGVRLVMDGGNVSAEARP